MTAENQTEMSKPVEAREWTPSRVAAVILLVILCGVLVWNAYHPEDVYISDLKFEVLQSDRFEPQKDQSVEGNTLAIQHGDTPTYYPRGVGVHANSEVFIKFLPNGYRFFVAEIGVDKEAAEIGSSSVVFQILSDGSLMYESPVLRAGMAPRFVRVCIEGRETLTLKVSDAGDGNEGDHADWAMARFTVQ